MNTMTHLTAAAATLWTAGLAAGQDVEYKHDDGSSESSLGAPLGPSTWLNYFETDPAGDEIIGVEVTFGTPTFFGMSGVQTGDDFTVFVFQDTDANPTNGATLVASAAAEAAEFAIDMDQFQIVGVEAAITDPFFFVAVTVDFPGGVFGGLPAPLDTQTAGEGPGMLGPSWFLAGDLADGASALADSVSLRDPDNEVAGVFLLRAIGVPAPAAATAALLAGLLAARRRR